MFTKKQTQLDRALQDVMDASIARIVKQVRSVEDLFSTLGEYAADKKRLTDLQIELDRVKEQHARENREIEHKVGLQRQRQKQEIELAKREAEVTVREQNLQAEKARFDRDVSFIKEQTREQRETMLEILRRLPDVNVMLGNQKEASDG